MERASKTATFPSSNPAARSEGADEWKSRARAATCNGSTLSGKATFFNEKNAKAGRATFFPKS